MTSSSGVQGHYQLQQIVQAEPSANLFRVPADYKQIVANQGKGTVVEVQNPPAAPR